MTQYGIPQRLRLRCHESLRGKGCFLSFYLPSFLLAFAFHSLQKQNSRPCFLTVSLSRSCIPFSISAKETETTPNKGSFPRNLISWNSSFWGLFFFKLCSSHGSGIRKLFYQVSKVFDFRVSLQTIAAKELSFAALCSCFCNRQVVPLCRLIGLILKLDRILLSCDGFFFLSLGFRFGVVCMLKLENCMHAMCLNWSC